METATADNLAYLVIREGAKWTDVFRLTPGRTVTIGRASTNQIVIKDERASRNHAEVFLTAGKWTIRDLESRNGTLVDGQPIRGDCLLSPGSIVRIAHTQLAFVYDLSRAFMDDGLPVPAGDETISGAFVPSDTESQVLDTFEPTTITHRRGQTRFLERSALEEPVVSRMGQAATRLCRLAFALASQSEIISVANMALDVLFDGTQAEAGALLLMRTGASELLPANLDIVASRSKTSSSYHRVSDFLASMVLRDGEAVLARNIEGDSALGIRDSRGEIHSTSVICAPVRRAKQVVGLMHLYCVTSNKTLDADDLEFTLAVAENVALALKNLEKEQELSENLSLTRSEVERLRKQLGAECAIVGSSPLILQVQQEIARAAPSRATVLIRGESGVGKEL
ncbi:MAG: FHA domain-containing protein, partial [Pirellulaceae bacterium]